MNLLKALFNPKVEDAEASEKTYLLTHTVHSGIHNLLPRRGDALAVVRSPIYPGQLGHVKFHGVRWRAYSNHPQVIPVETIVRVVGRRSNILVVELVEDHASSQPCEEIIGAATAMS